MTISAASAPLAAPTQQTPGVDAHQLAALRAEVAANAAALGTWFEPWQQDALRLTATARRELTIAEARDRNGDRNGAMALLSNLLPNEQTGRGQVETTRVNLHYRLEGRDDIPTPATGTPLPADAAAALTNTTAHVAAWSDAVGNQTIASSEQLLGAHSTHEAFDNAIAQGDAAVAAAKQWTLAFAKGDRTAMQGHLGSLLLAINTHNANQQLAYFEFFHDGLLAASDCGSFACTLYDTPSPQAEAALKAEVQRMGLSDQGNGRVLTNLSDWVGATDYALTKLAHARAELRLAQHPSSDVKDPRGSALGHLRTAATDLGRMAFALHMAAGANPSHEVDIPAGQPNPVDRRNTSVRGWYTRTVDDFARLRSQLAPTPKQVPPTKSLPTQPWVLFPGNGDHAPVGLPPSGGRTIAQAAGRALRLPALGTAPVPAGQCRATPPAH